MKPLVVVLSIVCLALAAQVWLRQRPGNRAHQEIAALSTSVSAYSNEVRESRQKAGEEAKLAAYLQSNLTAKAAELTALSNQLTEATTALETAQTAARKSDSRIAELEGQKDELQSKLNELAGAIRSLNTQIAEARRKLAAAEGDRDSLTRELTKLQSDKAELLRQFNDIAALKAQVALLRDEAAVNQRLAWMAQGVYRSAGRKGAEALMNRPGAPVLAGDPSLNVEVREKGTPSDEPAKSLPAR